jgi:predicted tellurium resistance membrane protein TerC
MDFQLADFVTIGVLVVLEGLLSADNALVLAVMILGLPRRDQKKALRYGLVGAFAFRSAATVLATYFIRMGWVKILGGCYLLYLTTQHLNSAGLVHFEIDKWLSLALIGIIFTIAYLRARRKGPVPDDDPMADEASVLLADNHSS